MKIAINIKKTLTKIHLKISANEKKSQTNLSKTCFTFTFSFADVSKNSKPLVQRL